MGLEDEKYEVKRFTNYVLMLAHEIMEDLKDDANNFRTPELNNFLRNEETNPFVQVVVVKTLYNLQNGIADWPGREKYFTYEHTLIKMKLAIDCIRAHSEIENKEIKNINFDKL